MIFRQSTQEDLDFVKANPYEGSVKDYPYMEVPNDNCYTAIFQDKIVGVGGTIIHWKGVAEVWLILTADCRKDGAHGLIALGAIKDKMEELLKINNIRRAQATVRADFPQAIRMIEFFGFEREGLLRQYCPDKGDAYRYAKIYDRVI